MSNLATQAAWELQLPAAPGVSAAAAKLVVLNLAARVGDDGRNAYPKVGTIARDCGLAVRTVQRTLRHVEHLGVIVVELPARVDFPATYALGPWYRAWMEQHGWGDKVTPRGRHHVTSRGAMVAPESVLESFPEVAASLSEPEPDAELLAEAGAKRNAVLRRRLLAKRAAAAVT